MGVLECKEICLGASDHLDEMIGKEYRRACA